MSSLRELQIDFMKAVLDGDPHNAGRHVSSRVNDPWMEPEHLLRIYANNASANFLDSLSATFPVTLRLVGGDYFSQCVRAFHRVCPSTCGDLQPAGAQFASFLANLHAEDEFRYLGDVAELEWLCQESLLAGDHLPLDLVKLASVAPEQYGELRFVLHPTARLFESIYPCAKIWQANSQDGEPETIDLRSAGTRIVIVRAAGGLQFQHLSSGEYEFLAALRTNTLVEATARVEDDVGFDCAAVLRRLVDATIIVDFK